MVSSLRLVEGGEVRKLTKQAAEDAQTRRVSGPVQEGHQAAPGAQVFPLEAKDPLHSAFRRRFVRLGRRIFLTLRATSLSISAQEST